MATIESKIKTNEGSRVARDYLKGRFDGGVENLEWDGNGWEFNVPGNRGRYDLEFHGNTVSVTQNGKSGHFDAPDLHEDSWEQDVTSAISAAISDLRNEQA